MKKVIIIEDSPTFCNMLGKKLEAKGWKTILCYNYRDGLKAVRVYKCPVEGRIYGRNLQNRGLYLLCRLST